LVLTELEGRCRDACFCCARWNDVASERSLSPPLRNFDVARFASRPEGAATTEPGALPGLSCFRPLGQQTSATPKPRKGGKMVTRLRNGGKRRNETGRKAQLVQDQLFTSPPRGHLGHVVPGISKIPRIRATAQEDRFHNSGELRVYREAKTDIPDPLFIPDKSAWPRLPAKASASLKKTPGLLSAR